MIYIKEINQKEIELCYELDSNTICLWTKKQWENEFKKKGVKILALFCTDKIIGVCVFQKIVDEAQINYFSVKKKYRYKGCGSYLMRHLIQQCEKFNLKKLLLEVSEVNLIAEKFYEKFNFSTVGIRKNYYKDGSNAVLKEKILIK